MTKEDRAEMCRRFAEEEGAAPGDLLRARAGRRGRAGVETRRGAAQALHVPGGPAGSPEGSSVMPEEMWREIRRQKDEHRRLAPEVAGGGTERHAEEARELETTGWERRGDGPKAI